MTLIARVEKDGNQLVLAIENPGDERAEGITATVSKVAGVVDTEHLYGAQPDGSRKSASYEAALPGYRSDPPKGLTLEPGEGVRAVLFTCEGNDDRGQAISVWQQHHSGAYATHLDGGLACTVEALQGGEATTGPIPVQCGITSQDTWGDLGEN